MYSPTSRSTPISLSEPGTYFFTLPKNGVKGPNTPGSAYAYGNDEMTFTFTIPATGDTSDNPVNIVKYSLAEGTNVLSGFDVWIDNPAYSAKPAYMLMDGVTIYNEAGEKQDVYVGNQQIWGEPEHWNFYVSPELTADGTYTIKFAQGLFYDPADPEAPESAPMEIKITIGNGGGGEIDPPGPGEDPELPVTFSPKSIFPTNRATVKADDGDFLVNITFPSHVVMKDGFVPVITKNGKEYQGTAVNMTSLSRGAVVLRDFFPDMVQEESGQISLAIPAGIFTDNEATQTNPALTYTWNFIQSSKYGQTNDDDGILILQDVFIRSNGVDYNMLAGDTKVPTMKDFDIYIMTNKNEKSGHLLVEIYNADQIGKQFKETLYTKWTFDNYQGIAGKTFAGKNEDGYFVFPCAAELEFLEGQEYVMEISAYQQYDGLPDSDRVWYGTSTAGFLGGSEAFKFSDAKILSISPEPGSVLASANDNKFVVTFSKPVTIDPNAKYNGSILNGVPRGSGAGLEPITLAKPNDDRTEWTLQIPRTMLTSGQGLIEVNIQAKDDQGLIVAPEDLFIDDSDEVYLVNAGFKDFTTQKVKYNYYFNAPKIKIDLEEGVVDEIYAFTVSPVSTTQISFVWYEGCPVGALQTLDGTEVCRIAVKDGDYELVPGGDSADSGYVAVNMHLEKPVTEPGEYKLVFPYNYFTIGSESNSKGSADREFLFTIEGQADLHEHVTLTVVHSDHVTVAAEVGKGHTATVSVTPAEGWKVETLMLNDEDVTAGLKDGLYTTPALNDNATLKANMAYDGDVYVKDTTTDILEVPGQDYRIATAGGEIIVTGLVAGQDVKVFSVGGAVLYSHKVNGDKIAIGVPDSVVIVVIDGKTAVKVIK